MSAMVGPRLPFVIFACALVAAVAGGCSRAVDGAASAQATVALPQLLIEPDRFPGGYPAVVLDPVASEQALRLVDGVPAGTSASPPECAPPTPRDAAAVVGSNGGDSLTVALSRADGPLRARRDQLVSCATFGVHDGAGDSTVSVTVLAAPPVNADDSYAVAQAVSGASAQSSLTLVAQLGDVRVTAGAATAAGQQPDTESLDTLFTDAVLKARHGGHA